MKSIRTIFFGIVVGLVPSVAQDNLKFGQPDCPGTVLNKQIFVICHSPERKIPIWVGYELDRGLLAGNANRTDDFRPDPAIVPDKRAELADYRGSGYDRGHMAPAADFRRNRSAMSTTFLLTNMAPQTPQLNRGRWAALESAVRQLAETHGHVWIFTGSIFVGNDPIEEIGPNRVAVPTHFYKVILCVHSDDRKEAFAFIMPNIARLRTGLSEFAFSVNFVERLTGLDFFSALPEAEQVDLESGVKFLP